MIQHYTVVVLENIGLHNLYHLEWPTLLADAATSLWVQMWQTEVSKCHHHVPYVYQIKVFYVPDISQMWPVNNFEIGGEKRLCPINYF